MQKIRNFFLKNQTKKQMIAKNTSWLFVGEVISRLLKFLLILYAARAIGVIGWGQFSYAMSLASICCFFSDAGLASLVTREYAKNSPHVSYVTNAFFLKITFVVFSFIVLLIAAPIFAHQATTIGLILLVGAFILMDSVKDFALSIYRAQQRMEIDAAAKIATTFLTTIIGFAIVFFLPNAYSLAIAYVAGSTLITIITLPSFIPHIKNTRLLDKKLLKQIFWDNLFFGILLFTNALMLNEDTVIVGMMRGSYDAGLYAAAQKIIQTVYIIPAVITTALLPMMSSHVHDPEKFHQLYEKIILFLLLLAIPIALGGALLAKPIIVLFYGVAYAGAAPVMSILFFCILAIFPSLFIVDSALSLNRHRELIWINIAGNIFNIITNIVLVHYFGIIGAGIAGLCTLLLITIWMLVFFKQVNFKPWKGSIIKIFMATLAMSVSVIGLRSIHFPMIGNVLVSGLIYFAILLVVREQIVREYIWKTINGSL